MIRNYFKIALRNIRRYKGYSFINIAGLALGIAACLLLFIVVNYELTYDHFQKNFKNIYRVVTQDKLSDGLAYNPGIPTPMLQAIRTNFPQVKATGINAINGSQVTVLGNGNNALSQKYIENNGIYFVEPQFFDLFDAHFLSGDAASLKDPGTVVLSKKTAEKYFGSWQQAEGKVVKLDNAILLKVTGVIDNGSAHTDLPLEVMISFETVKKNADAYRYSTEWGSTSSNFQIYTVLAPAQTMATFNQQLAAFCKNQYKNDRHSTRIHFAQPLSDIHFDTRFGHFGDHVTARSSIRTLVLIGLLIIVMACINFVNLSTAQAIGRSKEVGVRKVLGGSRLQLFWQMMGETGLIVLLAVVLALGIAKLSLPFIKHVASVQESLSLFTPTSMLFLFIAAITVTLLSGIYPALILSGFTPALALKNKINSASIGGISLRRGLVVTQFAISQVLVIGTIIAITQMNFVRNADLGFNKEAIYLLYANTDSTSISKQIAFKEELSKINGVNLVSLSSDVPSSDNNWGTNFSFNNGKDQDFTLFLKFGDADYVKTYGLQLLAGKNYEPSDTIRQVLVNETLVHKLGVRDPKEIVGKTLRLGGSSWREIVGVVKDFNTNSLRDAVKPIVISTRKEFYGVVGIKMRTNNIPATRAAIENAWNKYYPDFAFNAAYLDENIAHFYQQEEQLSLLYKIFAVIAILISCLGLYGLVSFMAVQKTKEVGIRKVLGASIGNIVYLFSREFTVLIIVAFVIAVPIAYYMMSSWLNNFVYRIPIGLSSFLLAVVISIVIAWLTVGYKAIRAAVANPVNSLRAE